MEVQLKELCIEADVVVGERTLPTLLNVVLNAAEVYHLHPNLLNLKSAY